MVNAQSVEQAVSSAVSPSSAQQSTPSVVAPAVTKEDVALQKAEPKVWHLFLRSKFSHVVSIFGELFLGIAVNYLNPAPSWQMAVVDIAIAGAMAYGVYSISASESGVDLSRA